MNDMRGESWILRSGRLSLPKTWMVLLALCGLQAAGAQPLGDFAGVRWDASPADAEMVLENAGAASVENDEPDRLSFQGGKFANKPALLWQLEFEGGKFRQGRVVLKPEGRSLFNTVCRYFTGLYGQPKPEGKTDEGVWLVPADEGSSEFVEVRSTFLEMDPEGRYPGSVRIQFARVPASAADGESETAAADHGEQAPVGSWKWDDAKRLLVFANGTVQAGRTGGTWSWKDRDGGIFEIRWDGGSVETLTLSADAEHLSKKTEDGRLLVASHPDEDDGEYFGSGSRRSAASPPDSAQNDLPPASIY